MSTQSKLEQVINLLINEDIDKAQDVLHAFMVEKSRKIYEDFENGDEEMGDDIGGDEKEDFVADIESNEDDIESDELQDGEVESEFEEKDTEERVEDLEAELESLRAQFAQLMQDELQEPYHDEADYDMDAIEPAYGDDEIREQEEQDDENDSEELEEATKFQSEVSAPSNKEGEFAGTGAKSQKSQVNTRSTFSNAQAQGEKKAVNFAGSAAENGGKADKPKDHTPSDNTGEVPGKVSHDSQSTEGKFVGTGKGSKSGTMQSQSPLSKKPQ